MSLTHGLRARDMDLEVIYICTSKEYILAQFVKDILMFFLKEH